MTTSFTSWLLMILSGAVPVSVLAETHASVQLHNFGYSLIDLNPDDGIAPSVTFHLDRLASAMYLAAEERKTTGEATNDSLSVVLPGVISPEISRFASVPSAQLSASFAGSLAARNSSAVLTGRLVNAYGDGLYSSEFSVSTSPIYSSAPRSVEVAPFTEMVWTGQLHLEIEKSGRGPGPRAERAEARVLFSFDDDDGRVIAGNGATLDTVHHPPGLITRDLDLRVSFANPRGESALTSFGASLTVTGRTHVEGVPEPSTVALLLTGVGFFGWVLRRRASPRLLL